MRETQLLKSAVSEYKCIVPSPRRKRARPLSTEHLVRKLCRTHDWTNNGACTIVSLANNYGTFMLRNALALAIALGKEDGELGF